MDRSREHYSLGCGSGHFPDITLNVQTTTGGNFSITVNSKHTVENLKKVVSKKLKVSKDRICLLHREQQLRNGTMDENGLMDGSRVILLPSVETGLLTHRPENSVMQALESLNDTQVNDFLSGKSPLNLTMRLGDHMMLIQLQLSTLNAVANCSSGQTKTTPPGPAAPNPALRRAYRISEKHHSQTDKLIKRTVHVMPIDNGKPSASTSESSPIEKECATVPVDDNNLCRPKPEDHLKSFLNKQDIETLQNAFEIFKSLAEMQDDPESSNEQGSFSNNSDDSIRSTHASASSDETTPIKSLSNFVSSPLTSTSYSTVAKSTIAMDDKVQVKTVPLPKFAPLQRNEVHVGDPTSSSSCLCSTINPNFMCDCHAQGGHAITKIENFESYNVTSNNYSNSDVNESINLNTTDRITAVTETVTDVIAPCSEVDTEKAINLSSGRSNEEAIETFTSGIQEPMKNRKLHYLLHRASSGNYQTHTTKQKMTVRMVNSLKRPANEDLGSALKSKSPKSSINDHSALDLSANDQPIPLIHTPMETNPVTDTKALIEASKNLTQTLKKLSKEVLTSKVNLNHEDATKAKIGQGAVIESMKHHGKGIYSGTFSGTLNPALQDRYGRPKRDISTIIHILNDLLCAAPAKIGEQQPESQQSSEPSTSEFTGASNSEHRSQGACECATCASQTCPYGQCDGHDPVPHSSYSSKDLNHRCSCTNIVACKCSADRLSSRTDKAERCIKCSANKSHGDKSKDCVGCHTATALALDNSKTKCKLDQLRLVMQREKQRREARKKAGPYSTAAALPAPGPSVCPQDKQNILAEEIDTVA